MEAQQYLTFHWNDLQYGIEAALVQEIFPLPEITPIAEASSDLIGILNLRGQIVAITHLDLLRVSPLKECTINDYLIIVQWEDLQIGIVANQANEVIELNNEAIEKELVGQLISDIDPAFISGIVQGETSHIVLLNPKTFIRQPDAILTLIWDAQSQLDGMAKLPTDAVESPLIQDELLPIEEIQTPKISSNFYELYCPNATPEEREIFRQRADNLKPSVEDSNVASELMPLAVIGLGNEYFGLDLDLVREFTAIGNLTPIPCCPKHIVGNMNLRGEIVTLVDIRNVLNLPTTPVIVGSQTVVVQVEDMVAGLPVDQVWEMVYLNAADITSLSRVSSEFGEQYLRGTAFFQEKILRVLDLEKIFTQGELVVNEQA